MSFFGPNAVVDDENTRIYDYKDDRSDLETGNSVNAPSGGQKMHPPMPGVPLQQLADMWKNANGQATPQEYEQMMMSRQMPPHPSMWMPPMMPPSSSANGSNTAAPMPPFPMPPMMPPNGQMPPMPNGQMLPPMPNGQIPPMPNGQMPPMPNGQMPPMPNGQMPPMPNGQMPPMPNGPMPPMGHPGVWGGPFGFQNGWGFPSQQQSAPHPQDGTQPQSGPPVPPQYEPNEVPQQMPQPQMSQQSSQQPPQQPSQPAQQLDKPTQEAKPAQEDKLSNRQKSQPKSQGRPQSKQQRQKPQTSAQRTSPRTSTPPEEHHPVSSDESAPAFSVDYSESGVQNPYSLTPRNKVTASSIAEAREHPRSGGLFGKRVPVNFHSEEYQAESEAIRPNRKFRHLMTDHDKRVVMDKCVKSMANDDPFVDDFYFHIFTRMHGAVGSSRAPAHRYRRVFNKGDGTTADKMRQQVQRAVDRAQENRQKYKEGGDRPPVRKAASASRPRQAVPALSQALASGATDSGNKDITREATLRNIESVYESLLALEAHAQRRPDPSDPRAAEWASEGPPLQEELWQRFLVQRPVDSHGHQAFVEMLLVPKGMKAFARSWPQFDPTRRLTVLTRLVVSIATVHVPANRFELFGQAVVQPIVHLIGEADFDTILLMADLAHSQAKELALSRVGQLLLTAIVSRGEMLATSAGDEEMEASWAQAFAPIFDEIAPVLDKLDVRDDQVWHFFAALALGSDLERQSELVDHVRSQIFGQQALAKKLGGEAGQRKIAALNLFLNVLGLNATLEDIDALAG